MTRFKTIIAGCGSMAHTWVEYTQQRQDTEIVALVDLYPQTEHVELVTVLAPPASR